MKMKQIFRHVVIVGRLARAHWTGRQLLVPRLLVDAAIASGRRWPPAASPVRGCWGGHFVVVAWAVDFPSNSSATTIDSEEIWINVAQEANQTQK